MAPESQSQVGLKRGRGARRGDSRNGTRISVCAGQPEAGFFPSVNSRKFVLRATSLEGLVELGSLTQRAASFLKAPVRSGLNIPGDRRSAGGEAGRSVRHPLGERPLLNPHRCSVGLAQRIWRVASIREVLLCQVG